MTQDEFAEFERRVDLQSLTEDRFEPAARAEKSFAGIYFDHSLHGIPVVLTTGSVDEMKTVLERAEPRLVDDFIVRQTDFTERDLETAADKLFANYADYIGDVEVYSVSVDTSQSELVVGIRVEQMSLAMAKSGAVPIDKREVPFRVERGEPSIEVACTSREYCTSPMKAGNVIRRGSTDGSRCTMGFHIVRNGVRQFVSAGHCSYNNSTLWYQRVRACGIPPRIRIRLGH
ncbi:hypothetical protein G1H11_01595 [Phytoactinopolyspora alkaliphila]|uniref:Uncharacterized protein n=1 Tax=Phytoactinopolyspora alkaliphila TaxID=1783498 RepID=A0A6N9YGG5_9ACTN|nr:hypothetical protein [Phytoactinopolyspora alkaliphila]NED94005.1 hypothetical protein [Phytoactinopolyspora alkaliphila]